MANVNLTELSCTVVVDHPIWAGVQEQSNTDWLQAPIGSNAAIGASSLMIVDLTLDQGELATTFDLTDTGITGVSGTAVLSILGLTNITSGTRFPQEPSLSGATITFTGGGAPGVGDGDVIRATLLYR